MTCGSKKRLDHLPVQMCVQKKETGRFIAEAAEYFAAFVGVSAAPITNRDIPCK